MTLQEKLNFDSLKQFPYRINWNMNLKCNLKCRYCFFPHVKKEDPDVFKHSPEHISSAFERTGKEWLIMLSGGEPFLYPGFIKLCQELSKKNWLQISTNLTHSDIHSFCDTMDPERIFVINASVHVLSHSGKSMERFIDHFQYVRSKGFHIIASYVTYPELFKNNKIEKDFDFLKNRGVWPVIPLTYNGIYKKQTYPGHYTQEQLAVIYKLAQDKRELLNATGNMKFTDYLCVAGSRYFFMDIRGDVYRCVSDRTYLGNMFNHTFSSMGKTEPCRVDYCNDSCNGIVSVLKDHPLLTEGGDEII